MSLSGQFRTTIIFLSYFLIISIDAHSSESIFDYFNHFTIDKKSYYVHSLEIKPLKIKTNPNVIIASVLIDEPDQNQTVNDFINDGIIAGYLDMSRSQYMFEKTLARAVFKTDTPIGAATSSLVGKNIIMTAAHVMGSLKNCTGINIRLNHKRELVACREVLYCVHSSTEDYCFLRMGKISNGLDIGDKVVPQGIDFDNIPNDMTYATIIGNPLDTGLSASSAMGAIMNSNDVSLFSYNMFTFVGNSGAPVFNEM